MTVWSMEMTREKRTGLVSAVAGFLFFAFLSSAKSQPIEFRVSFPSSFMSQAKPSHGPTGISDD